jgi:hypothetical protein
MKYHPFFILMLLTLSACPERTDDMEKLDSRIYMAGTYSDWNLLPYWTAGSIRWAIIILADGQATGPAFMVIMRLVIG